MIQGCSHFSREICFRSGWSGRGSHRGVEAPNCRPPPPSIRPCWCFLSSSSWKCLIFPHSTKEAEKGSKALHFILLAAGRAAENPGQGPRDPEMSCLTRGPWLKSHFCAASLRELRRAAPPEANPSPGPCRSCLHSLS